MSPRIAGEADPGQETCVNHLRRLAEELGVVSQVTFVGPADEATKETEFRRADVFALPSYEEDFTFAAVEAMAYGIPVVVSQQVAVAEDVAHSGAGLVVADTTCCTCTRCFRTHRCRRVVLPVTGAYLTCLWPERGLVISIEAFVTGWHKSQRGRPSSPVGLAKGDTWAELSG